MEDQKPTAETKQPKRSRLRFSLGTLFVAAIILTLIASNVFTSWHLQQARRANRIQQMEIDVLRKELRFLDTTEKEHVHIIALETNHDMVWKWRVFTPDGKKFALKSVIGEITDRNFPHDQMYTFLKPGEIELTYDLVKNAVGNWEQTIKQHSPGRGSSGTEKIPSDKMEWYGKNGSSTTSGSITPVLDQQSYSGDHRIELLRLRKWMHEDPTEMVDPSEPADGILLWLEPVQESED